MPLLVIEGEPLLRQSILRGLGKLPGLALAGAATLDEALDRVDREPPRFVLCDLDLPDRSGLELLDELDRRRIACPVTFLSPYARTFAAPLPGCTHARVVAKPATIDRLRAIVRMELGTTTKRSARAECLGYDVAEYVRLACMGEHSVRLTVDRGADRPLGRLLVSRGVLWAAEDELGRGEDAFLRLALAPGKVSCRTLRSDAGPREILSAWDALLRDATRSASSERDATGGRGEPESAAIEGSDALLFHERVNAGLAALLDGHLEAAWTAFREAERLQPGDPTVETNLARLRAAGLRDQPPRG